jgi:hypothetical protein
VTDKAPASVAVNEPISAPSSTSTAPILPSFEATRRYAAFTPHQTEGKKVSTVFEYEILNIRVVQSIQEIPKEDLKRAIIPSAFWQPSKSSVNPEQLAPYLFHGDVDIEVGDVVGEQKLYAFLMSQNGDLKQANLQLVPEPRGPPSEKGRNIYIVGHVRSFTSPDTHDTSTSTIALLDLRGFTDRHLQGGIINLKNRPEELDVDFWRRLAGNLSSLSSDNKFPVSRAKRTIRERQEEDDEFLPDPYHLRQYFGDTFLRQHPEYTHEYHGAEHPRVEEVP